MDVFGAWIDRFNLERGRFLRASGLWLRRAGPTSMAVEIRRLDSALPTLMVWRFELPPNVEIERWIVERISIAITLWSTRRADRYPALPPSATGCGSEQIQPETELPG